MKSSLTKALFAALAALALAAPAMATNQGTLPDGAIPLTPAETQAVYVGHTAKYDIPDAVVSYTWKPDGRVLAVWEGRNGKAGQVSPADGTWTVSGNQICYDVDFYSTDTGQSAHHESLCRQWWKAGKALWLKNASGDTYENLGNIYPSHYANLTSGDQVSGKYAKYKAKLPH